MKMDIVAGSKNDEFYTPVYAIKPILKYIPQGSVVWCPFDTEQSNFVKMFNERGCKTIATHISNGQDFFVGKPFAMLVGVIGLFESKKRFDMFKNNDFEIMYFNKRIAYFQNYDDEKPSLNPPFSSVYICHNILPKQIVFEEINNG